MSSKTIAYFITPHGYGHATRAAAVMAAVQAHMPETRFELFTTCPSHIFVDSRISNFGYHDLHSDIGMVQNSPLVENPEATCRQLDSWLPFDEALVDQVAGKLTALNCNLVACDIAPLGIVAAHCAGLPAMLVENFTWDWIYQAYISKAPGLKEHVDYLTHIFSKVDFHIQTTPRCQPAAKARHVPPISRKPRTSRSITRDRLHIPEHVKMVLVSMGGIPDTFDFLNHLPPDLNIHLVIPGANETLAHHKRVTLLPTPSEFFHPDLIHAADVLVGKLGYSTVAEAYHAGIPFGYIRRPGFPESARLESFICKHLTAKAIDPQAYRNGCWIDAIAGLLNATSTPPERKNGADVVAEMLHEAFS